MTALFKKLNFKDQNTIVVINAPDEFKTELQAIGALTTVLSDSKSAETIEFAMVIAERQTQIDEGIDAIARKLKGDAVVWFCYPKGTSRKYKCDFNRDTGWAKLGEYNMEPVRQVAVDENWSALRFRKLEYIKKLTRSDKMRLTSK